MDFWKQGTPQQKPQFQWLMFYAHYTSIVRCHSDKAKPGESDEPTSLPSGELT